VPIDVRIDPEVSSAAAAGRSVQVSAVHLGGVPRGAVLIVAGPAGLGPVESVDVMNALAQHGYESVLATPTGLSPDGAVTGEIVQVLMDRLEARGWTPDQTGLIGYGRGAGVVVAAAAQTPYGAAVSIPRDAGELVGDARVTALRTPWLGIVGLGSDPDLDRRLREYRTDLADASPEYTSVVGYPGVDHCLHDSTEASVHAAAFDAWQRTAEWLNTHVAFRPTPSAEAWNARITATRPASA